MIKLENILYKLMTVIDMVICCVLIWHFVEDYQSKMGILFVTALVGWVVFIPFAAMEAAAIIGIFQSFILIKNIVVSYLINDNARLNRLKDDEPSYLRLSGYWPYMIGFAIQDTWASIGSRDNDAGLISAFLGIRRLVFTIDSLILAILFTIFALIVGILSIPYLLLYWCVWAIDRVYLGIKKVFQPCGNCQTPHFYLHYECPNCKKIHKKLVPGHYGVLKHKCQCGEKLPCSFFSGRSSLKAICPTCNYSISSTGTRPVMIQLIGGSGSGKTVFLAAFWGSFLELLKKNKHLKGTVASADEDSIQEVVDWYMGVPCSSTNRMNSKMYSVRLHADSFDVDRKFIMYDIAGEMFNNGKAENVINQQQFHYCNGMIFIVDPFSCSAYRETALSLNEKLPLYSKIESEAVINTFLNYMTRSGIKKVGSRYQMPFAVVITKADVGIIRKRINIVKIRSAYNKNPKLYGNLDRARDLMCKEFLVEIGLGELVSIIETRFTKVHFYIASSIGHEPDGTKFEPFGIWEPINWIVNESDKELGELLAKMYSEQG